MAKFHKPLAAIFEDETGWRIQTEDGALWPSSYPAPEVAAAHALHSGCRVEDSHAHPGITLGRERHPDRQIHYRTPLFYRDICA
jgi:hypothetical protein